MNRPRLLQRRVDIWKDPWTKIEESDPPYSAFILSLTRASVGLLALAAGLMVIGNLQDNGRLIWGALALMVPAVLYLLLVYAWAWARAALDEVSYGNITLDESEPPPTVTAQKPSRNRIEAWWRARRRKKPTERRSDANMVWRLTKECRRYWIHIVGVLLISLAATPIFLLSPIPLKIAVDSVLKGLPLPEILSDHLPGFFSSSGFSLLVVATLLQVTVSLLSQVQSLASTVLSTYAGEKMALDLRARMFRHVQQLPVAFHDTKGATESAYRVQYDSPALQAITIGGFIPIVSSSFTLITAVVVSTQIDWQLTFAAIAIAPLLFMSSQRFKNQMRPHYTGIKVLETRALGVIQEVLTSMRVVKAFGREEGEQKRFEDVSGLGVAAKLKLGFAEGIFGIIASTTVSIGAAAVLFIGVRHVQTGVITLGELLVVMGYTAQLFKPLRTFTKQIGRFQSSLASAERVFELLDQEPDVVDRPHAQRLKHSLGEIQFANVSFSYDPAQPLLKDVSFHIDPGSTIGIAGRTGAGKSTLLSLMMRFYEPDSGLIKLDGHDIRDYRVADVRSQFALVLQEPVLFSTTIAENIRYGRPDASMEEVIAAAEAANAHSFISSTPQGYDSLVGERGMKLSGGERQRISLARAFLKNSSILILDEPTSSVDVYTEAEIMEALKRLMEGRTTLMIAHRLQTLETCNRILFVRDGAVSITAPDELTTLLDEIDLEEPVLQAPVEPVVETVAGRAHVATKTLATKTTMVAKTIVAGTTTNGVKTATVTRQTTNGSQANGAAKKTGARKTTNGLKTKGSAKTSAAPKPGGARKIAAARKNTGAGKTTSGSKATTTRVKTITLEARQEPDPKPNRNGTRTPTTRTAKTTAKRKAAPKVKATARKTKTTAKRKAAPKVKTTARKTKTTARKTKTTAKRKAAPKVKTK